MINEIDEHNVSFLYFLLRFCSQVAELFARINRRLVLQDGQIDYGEFATIIGKGNGGIGGQHMRSTQNFKDALRLRAMVRTKVIDGHL